MVAVAVSRLGLKGSMPRPLLVVHSGKTTTTRSGYCSTRVSRSTKSAVWLGISCGCAKARRTACRRVIGSTSRDVGYDAVKTGSKIAARYKASMGDAQEAAMMVPSCGRRFKFLLMVLRESERVLGRQVQYIPSFDAVNLQIDPPYSRNTDNRP